MGIRLRSSRFSWVRGRYVDLVFRRRIYLRSKGVIQSVDSLNQKNTALVEFKVLTRGPPVAEFEVKKRNLDLFAVKKLYQVLV